ncbi:alpha/beta-hydrolase [Gyrodon lividus]|nr:alpha/beta-hydrolase [Gyrodon lividus]
MMKTGGAINMGGSASVLNTRGLALPRQLHCSYSQMPSTPLLRYRYPSQSDTDYFIDLPTGTSPASCSRPPSPMLNALREALTESILPSPPPPVKLHSFSASHALSRSPPLLSSVQCTYPTASLSAAHDTPLDILHPTSATSSLLLSTPRMSPAHSPTNRSSLDTLRSIHTSAPAPITSSPSLGRWWFQSDPDVARKQSMEAVLDEEDLLDSKLRMKFRAPKAPLVFCHGLLGFDSVTIGPAIAPLQVSHWRGIKEILEANGCEVLITRVPATSSPIDRAKVLEKKISDTYPDRGVHLIGHSMGGLDCRYLVTHLTQRNFRVLSLTTIATPHYGSSFASHFLALASTHLPAVLALLELLPNGGGDGKAFECLTREAMKEFNENTPDVEGVRYFSWGAEYEPGLIDAWKYPHTIISAQEGPNDGLVSVQSARWGTYLGTLHNVNHLDLVGWTGGLAGNLTTLAGLKMGKDMHAFIRGKDVGFSAGRFYGGVADLLAGVEEEEGYVIDGHWVGWEGKEERKKEALREAASAEEAVTGAFGGNVDADGIRLTASDKERWRMEEMLRYTPSPFPSPSGSSSPSPPEEDELLEMHTRTRSVAAIPTQGQHGLGDVDAEMEDVRQEIANEEMTEVVASDSESVLQLEAAIAVEREAAVHASPDSSSLPAPLKTSSPSTPRP